MRALLVEIVPKYARGIKKYLEADTFRNDVVEDGECGLIIGRSPAMQR